MTETKVIEVAIEKKTRTRAKKAASEAGTYKSFRVVTTRDKDGYEDRVVEVTSAKLCEFMRNYLNIEGVYDDVPKLNAVELFSNLDQIRNTSRRFDNHTLCGELISFLETENRSVLERIANMVERGQMSFALCRTLFSPGTEIEIHGDELLGGRVVESEYRRSMFGSFLLIRYEYVSTDGQNLVQARTETRLQPWNGVREISRMPIRPLSAENREVLTRRGEMFSQVAIGAHYMNYRGHMLVKKWWSEDQMRSDGRIMVDAATHGQFVDNYRDDDQEDLDTSAVDSTMLWMTDPYIKGFSFATKQWGRFAINQISNIEYRDNAFDQLVLAQDKKDLVRALVVNSGAGFSDIISGKGGGCIFLLHGDPGVGKTLTAEAIAELLHRPLYSVAVGELGTNTEQLEKSLRQILDVAQIWNAVILLDEADIYLEKRGSDVLRNALTSVFLRLTEYHQGVMFLTTNRVTTFDPAFYSRISVALKYGELTVDSRERIWRNLLEAAKITGLDCVELAKMAINGRQIKNSIRLAQGLALQEGVPVSTQHIMNVVELGQQFQQDLKEG